MMCGCRKSLRFWISRLIFPTTSRFLIFWRFRIFTATLWPVSWWHAADKKERTCYITTGLELPSSLQQLSPARSHTQRRGNIVNPRRCFRLQARILTNMLTRSGNNLLFGRDKKLRSAQKGCPNTVRQLAGNTSTSPFACCFGCVHAQHLRIACCMQRSGFTLHAGNALPCAKLHAVIWPVESV